MGTSTSCHKDKWCCFPGKKIQQPIKQRVFHQPISLQETDLPTNLEGSRVTAWIQDFDILLADPVGIRIFAEFLKKEHSHENIDFWYACEEYKNTDEGEERMKTAEEIMERYLSPAATEPVNLNSICKSNIDGCLETASIQNPPDKNLFIAAQRQIYNLMKSDSFFRFIKSDHYVNCLPAREIKEHMSRKHYPSITELEQSKSSKTSTNHSPQISKNSNMVEQDFQKLSSPGILQRTGTPGTQTTMFETLKLSVDYQEYESQEDSHQLNPTLTSELDAQQQNTNIAKKTASTMITNKNVDAPSTILMTQFLNLSSNVSNNKSNKDSENEELKRESIDKSLTQINATPVNMINDIPDATPEIMEKIKTTPGKKAQISETLENISHIKTLPEQPEYHHIIRTVSENALVTEDNSISLVPQNGASSFSVTGAREELQEIVLHIENAIIEMEKTLP